MPANGHNLSLVVPCYNEGPTFVDNVHETLTILDHTPWSYELIFVDDGSGDDTRKHIDEIIAAHPERDLKKIFHEHNTGRGGAVMDGMRAADGDVVGFIDIDQEVHARYIPSHVIAIQRGADIAVANRIYKVQPRLFHRFILSCGYHAIVKWLLRTQIADTEGGYKFFKRDRILPLLNDITNKGWFWDTEIIVRAEQNGLQIVEIPCLFIRRYDKKSTVRPIHDAMEYISKLIEFNRSQAKHPAKKGP